MKVSELKHIAGGALFFVDGQCLDDSNVVFLRQPQSTMGTAYGYIEFGVFNPEYQETIFFGIDSSYLEIMHSIAIQNSTIYIASVGHLFTINAKKQTTKLLAVITLESLTFTNDRCSNDTSSSSKDLFPVEMAVRNDSILIDYSELHYPLVPLIGRVTFDKDMRPNVSIPDTLCLSILFPDGREFKQGACTVDAWLKAHNTKVLPVYPELNDTCIVTTYDSAWVRWANKPISRKTPEQLDSTFKALDLLIDTLRKVTPKH